MAFSTILIYHSTDRLRVALATSDVQSILEIPATNAIWRIETMVLPESNRTMAYLQHATQSTAVESCGTRTIKGGINLHMELQKHKLDQIAQEKHKDFSRQEYSFLEVMLRRLRRKM